MDLHNDVERRCMDLQNDVQRWPMDLYNAVQRYAIPFETTESIFLKYRKK